ncbi:MAG: hypothetical protein WAW75_01680 [Gallionella sp.]
MELSGLDRHHGGEELAVVITILDTLGKDFAQLLHRVEDQKFFVTFSYVVADNFKL